MTNYVIVPNPRGYFELYINGEFAGNHDSWEEAKAEAESIAA